MAEVAGEDRPASQVMRELMRGYIEQRRQAREYDGYLQRKVDAGRASTITHATVCQCVLPGCLRYPPFGA